MLEQLKFSRRMLQRQYLNFLLCKYSHFAFFCISRNFENLLDESELPKRRHEMDRSRKALFYHNGVDMLDSLTNPGELQPNPLFIVVAAHLFS